MTTAATRFADTIARREFDAWDRSGLWLAFALAFAATLWVL